MDSGSGPGFVWTWDVYMPVLEISRGTMVIFSYAIGATPLSDKAVWVCLWTWYFQRFSLETLDFGVFPWYFHGISMIFPGLDNPNSFEFTRGAQVWRPQERGWDATVAERRGRKQGAEGAPALGGGYKDWEVLGLGYHWVSLGITRYLPWVSCLEILIFW